MSLSSYINSEFYGLPKSLREHHATYIHFYISLGLIFNAYTNAMTDRKSPHSHRGRPHARRHPPLDGPAHQPRRRQHHRAHHPHAGRPRAQLADRARPVPDPRRQRRRLRRGGRGHRRRHRLDQGQGRGDQVDQEHITYDFMRRTETGRRTCRHTHTGTGWVE